jgi:acyl-coenzyme A thioesterase PaaI-like protein
MNKTSKPEITLSPWLEGARQFFSQNHPLFARFQLAPIAVDEHQVSIRAMLDDAFMFRPNSSEIFGGAMTIILDTVFGFAVIAHLQSLQPIATINLKAEYTAKANAGTTIECHAKCYAIRGPIAFVRGDILCVDTGKILATATGTFMIGTKGPNFGQSELGANKKEALS